MSYENAPATKLLATHCCACGRPLVDAHSVEVLMGPDCRKKYMDKVAVEDTARQEANKIVNYIATHQEAEDIGGCIAQLKALGFDKLATILNKRLVPVEIVQSPNGDLIVRTPYSPAFVEATRNLPGRWFVRENKTTRFNAAARAGLWQALKANFAGKRALGPKGFFTI